MRYAIYIDNHGNWDFCFECVDNMSMAAATYEMLDDHCEADVDGCTKYLYEDEKVIRHEKIHARYGKR